MKTLRNKGEAVSLWLGGASSPEVAKVVAREIGYNDSPIFGAKKQKIKLMGEIVMVNTAIAIAAVNRTHDQVEAKEVIDSFLATSRTHIFAFLDARFPDFANVYESRMAQYFPIFSGDKPGLGLSFGFLHHLGKDPLANLPGQLAVAIRFEQSLRQITEELSNSQAARTSASKDKATPAPKEVPGLGDFMAQVNQWPDREAQLAAFRIVDAAITGSGEKASHLLEELTIEQVRIVVKFLKTLDADELDD